MDNMPARFRRATFKKRSMFRRKRPRFRKRVGISARIKRVLKNPRIGGFLGIENKFFDSSLSPAALTAPTDASGGEHDPSATVLFNSVATGDGQSQKDGRQITMRNLTIQGQIAVSAQTGQSASDSGTLFYIAVVLDKQTNGATINSEDVYVNPSGVLGTASDPFRNLANIKRFRVLATRKLNISNLNMTNDTGSTGGVIQSGVARRFKIFVNLRGMVTTYTGTDGTVSTIRDNSLHLIAYASSVSAAPTIQYQARLRYSG